jgi:hypothetical protein
MGAAKSSAAGRREGVEVFFKAVLPTNGTKAVEIFPREDTWSDVLIRVERAFGKPLQSLLYAGGVLELNAPVPADVAWWGPIVVVPRAPAAVGSGKAARAAPF